MSNAPNRRPVRRFLPLVLAIFAGLLVVGIALWPARPARPTDVILIVVDTLRADRLGRYGYGKGLTPVLDGLADRGTRFAHAYATTSWTMPSVASLLTSRLPSQHLVRDFDSRLPGSELTLAERLEAAGFANAGFTANWRLSADLGYGQGFPTWLGFLSSEGSPIKARGEVVRTAALRWLDGGPADGAAPPTGATPTGGGARPSRLLYLQFMEPHVPFEPPAPLRARFAPSVGVEQAARLNAWARSLALGQSPLSAEELAQVTALYDGDVAAADAELGLLFEALEQRGILKDALVIVTADHGEELLEHGNFGHGSNLFDETVRVPLIMAGPGVPAGRVVNQNVSLIDVAPTVLELLGLPPEGRFEGRSLVPLLRDEAPANAVDVILQLPRKTLDWDLRQHREGLVRGSEKLLVGPEGVGELFDLAADPGEQMPQGPPAGATLQAALEAANAELAARQQPQEEKAHVDEATKEKLRALGYQTD